MRSLTVMDGISDGVVMDITHSLQKPGADGGISGGDRSFAVQMGSGLRRLGGFPASSWKYTRIHPGPLVTGLLC